MALAILPLLYIRFIGEDNFLNFVDKVSTILHRPNTC